MAEINKLEVGKVLEKLRSNDAEKATKSRQIEDKVKAIDEEVARNESAEPPPQARSRHDQALRDLLDEFRCVSPR